MSVKKNGTITTPAIYDAMGTDVLLNTAGYRNPYAVTGTASDIIVVTDMYGAVTGGKTYYLTANCTPAWSASHTGTSSAGKGTIWLYLLKTYDATNKNFDSPILFTSSNWVKEGLWKYTVPDDYNMARVRLNTYSDGSTSVTCYFWDIHLIPEEHFVLDEKSFTKITPDYTECVDFIEN